MLLCPADVLLGVGGGCAQPAGTVMGTQIESYGWFGKFCVDSEKSGPKCPERTKAQADEHQHLMLCSSGSCSVPGVLRQWLFRWSCKPGKGAYPFTKILIWRCFSEQNFFVLFCLSHEIHEESLSMCSLSSSAGSCAGSRLTAGHFRVLWALLGPGPPGLGGF